MSVPENPSAAPLAHLWVLAGGGWDGAAEATCERCHREVEVRWGVAMPELTDTCSATRPALGMTTECPTCRKPRVAGHNGPVCVTDDCPESYKHAKTSEVPSSPE